MILLADPNAAALLDLRVTFQAEIRVPLDKEFGVDRTMRLMTRGASFAHCFVFEHEWTDLIPVAISATLVQPRHRQPAGRSSDVRAMRIMTIAAAETAFEDRMMLRQVELRVSRQVTLETRGGFVARIDDPFPGARPCHMPAAGAVTRFASRLAGHPEVVVTMELAMGASGKHAGVFLMALGAGGVAHIRGALDGRRGVHRTVERSAGGEPQQQAKPCPGQQPTGPQPGGRGTHKQSIVRQRLKPNPNSASRNSHSGFAARFDLTTSHFEPQELWHPAEAHGTVQPSFHYISQSSREPQPTLTPLTRDFGSTPSVYAGTALSGRMDLRQPGAGLPKT